METREENHVGGMNISWGKGGELRERGGCFQRGVGKREKKMASV